MTGAAPSPLDVLVVTTTWPRYFGDSTPGFVADLARAMGDRHKVDVITPRRLNTVRHELMDGVSVHRFWFGPQRFMRIAEDAMIPALRSQPVRLLEVPFLLAAMLLATARAARRIRPDVIHAHWVLPAGVLGLAVARTTGARLVITVHGADVHALGGPLLGHLKRFVFRSADSISVVSEDLRERVVALSGIKDVPVIPMGVDAGALRELAGTPERRPNQIVFVGRLAEKKGVSVLLEALSLCSNDITLRVVGDGPLAADLHRLARNLKILARVEFLGALPRQAVATEIASADVLAIPSVRAKNGDMDGTPVVLGEAIALGTPVVASRLGGLAENLTEETAWLVPANDPEALALALTQALVRRDATERARNATRDVLPNLSIESVARRYESLYCRGNP